MFRDQLEDGWLRTVRLGPDSVSGLLALHKGQGIIDALCTVKSRSQEVMQTPGEATTTGLLVGPSSLKTTLAGLP